MLVHLTHRTQAAASIEKLAIVSVDDIVVACQIVSVKRDAA